MMVWGTQMHIVTACFIGAELALFILQLGRYFLRLRDHHRGWFVLLLFLLLFYNVASGLLPNPRYSLSVSLQNMIAYGSGFLMASYFPFYFYKEFELKALRWHALFGVPLFLLLPYLIFFIIIYALNGNLYVNVRYGLVIPVIYYLILLRAIFLSIRRHYKNNRDDKFYVEEMTVYCAIIPWVAVGVLDWLRVGQLPQIICANTGFLVITVIFFFKSARRARLEYMLQEKVTIGSTSPALFHANCLHYGLTRMQILIIKKIHQGMSNKQVAESLYISENTVKKHVQNIYRKTSTNNRTALYHKLQYPRH